MRLHAHLMNAECDWEDVQRFMTDHFQGTVNRVTAIPETGYRNVQPELFSELSLSLTATVEQSIVEHFLEIKVDYNAGTSTNPVFKSGTTKLNIETFPNVLQLHLKRFEYGTAAQSESTKVTNRCGFPDVLDFHVLLGVESPKYCLHSVLVHTGTVDSGHFFVYIRPNIRNDDWFKFDDNNKVVKVTKIAATEQNFGSSGKGTRSNNNVPTAYMLIYIMDTAIDKLLEVPSLDVSFNEETLQKATQDIFSRITGMNDKSLSVIGDAGFFDFGRDIVEKLSNIVDEMPSNDSDYFKSVAEACSRLVSIADNFNRSNERKTFILYCQELISRCENMAKWIVGANAVAKCSLGKSGSEVFQKPALAAHVAHTFPYSFSLFSFDDRPFQAVNSTIASLLFKDFERKKLSTTIVYRYLQHPDECGGDDMACQSSRPIPPINRKGKDGLGLYVGLETLDWFFQSLSTLFPDVMVLSPNWLHWDHQFPNNKGGSTFDTELFRIFCQNVKDRRPPFVMHPFNLPRNLELPRSKANQEGYPQGWKGNPDSHFVLTFIAFDWTRSSVSCKISVLDPYNDDGYISAAIKCYKTVKCFDSFNPVFKQVPVDPIQFGRKNIHCGVYILALALNAIFGTLANMADRLNPRPNLDDTCNVGLELRALVAWDCTQLPSLLDTCLLMCPKFSPISRRSEAVTGTSAWWVQTQYHNIADSLAIKYGSIFTPVDPFRGALNETQVKSCFGRYVEGRKPSADGPFFFKNDKLLVKVNCIGLIGHRLRGHHIAVKRAACAFHEAASTQCVCKQKGWFCETFGLICVGLVCPCAFVCIVRTLGTPVPVRAAQVGPIFHGLSTLQLPSPSGSPQFAMHGDPHRGNAVLVTSDDGKLSEVQLVDLDRTILIKGTKYPPIFLFSWYATSIEEQPRNPFHIKALMRIIDRSGLRQTHEYFSKFYTSDTFLQQEFNAVCFEGSPANPWEYDAFLHLFDLISDAGLDPKLISDREIHCKLDNNIIIHGFDKPMPGNIEVSYADGTLPQMLLRSESETVTFFRTILAQQKGSDAKTLDTETAKDRQSAQATAASGQTEPIIRCALDHLMKLLTREASKYGDAAPQLQNSHDKDFISCYIHPVCSRDTAVPCKIFVERTAIGSIKICSAEFQHHQKGSFLQENFTKHSMLFNLENEAEIERFFNFALSMSEQYGSISSDDSNDDSDTFPSRSSLGKQGLDQKVDNVRKGKKIKVSASARQDMGWPNWLYWTLLEECGNELVLKSVKESMMRRFGKTGSLTNLELVTKLEPLNALRPEYFECEVVLVENSRDRQRCLTFIEGESHLSFDTERAVLKEDWEGPCLIQIGTTTNVFIIQVAIQPKEFWLLLQRSLSATKTLICWGDDKKALLKVLPEIMCVFQDLQLKFSTPQRKKGLDDCVANMFLQKYVLSKTWTLSGWDNPKLTMDQIRYASLDVVACHALFLSGCGKSVFESCDEYITFYAFDSSQSSKFKHGFSFTSEFLGHYKKDSISRGFAFDSSKLLPSPQLHGFRALEDTSHGVNNVDVNGFLSLLNSFKFCCSLCSSCWVLHREWRFFYLERGSFSYLKSSKAVVSHSSVDAVSTNTDEQYAFFCLSMVAIFLRMNPSADNLQSLKRSVCSDIYYGYIRETLAHLT